MPDVEISAAELAAANPQTTNGVAVRLTRSLTIGGRTYRADTELRIEQGLAMRLVNAGLGYLQLDRDLRHTLDVRT